MLSLCFWCSIITQCARTLLPELQPLFYNELFGIRCLHIKSASMQNYDVTLKLIVATAVLLFG